jgi:hypothetical protein
MNAFRAGANSHRPIGTVLSAPNIGRGKCASTLDPSAPIAPRIAPRVGVKKRPLA